MEDPSMIYPQMKPQFPEQEILKCPRCESTNTKFCYYNNYNLSQPRHFCKNCKRYWTKGGTLRNIPIGGASRKATKRSSNKRSSTTHEKTELLAVPALDHNSRIDVDVTGQFGNLLEAYTGKGSLNQGAVLGSDGAAQSGNNNTDEYWDSSSSTNDWPDLAIYNSGSSFQL